ncbi:MAG: GAF and ANTAR domain-containing protein [Acidimicrobiia bacterium]
MASHALLMQALRSFASVMGRSYDLIEMSFQLAERVTEALGVEGTGVSVADQSGDLKYVSATSEPIVTMEEIQEKIQEGPCVMAFRTQQPMVVADIADIEGWADYKETATELGLGAVIGYPLSYDGARLGALNIYASHPRSWTDDDLDVLGVFGDMAAAYLVRSSQLAESRELAKQLQGALDSRVLIEQAKGVLANEYGIGVDDAFERLRQHSQDQNLKLIEVSRRVVESGLKIAG